MAEVINRPDDYRSTTYRGYRYATPLRPCREAARVTHSAHAIIDWVHPHPEEVAFLGGSVAAVILLPGCAALKSRLATAGRLDRVDAAIEERVEIARRLGEYRPPWYVLDDDDTIQQHIGILRTMVYGTH
jgi:hypothetical protein